MQGCLYLSDNKNGMDSGFIDVPEGAIVNKLFIFLYGQKKRITFAQIILQCAIITYDRIKNKSQISRRGPSAFC